MKTFREVSATTENMSRTGMLVSFDGIPPEVAPRVGDVVRVVVELPVRHGLDPKCLDCMATVVRTVESPSGPPQVAVRIRRMRFRDVTERADEPAPDLNPELASPRYLH